MDIKKELDLLSDIGLHLRSKNRFSLPEALNKKIESYCENAISNLISIPKGTEFWRCRLMNQGQESVFPKSEMGAPPPNLASAGRINPEGISYLYVASEEHTAISEVRPWVGADISSAQLLTDIDLNLVDMRGKELEVFNVDKYNTSDIENQINKQLVARLYFSAPVYSGDNLAYITSQFIAERLKNSGADGILYPSVLNKSGTNVCLFDPQAASVISVRRVQIKQVEYKIGLI